MTNLTFGRYAPYDTMIHRLDPRTKFLAMVLLMVIVFMPFKVWSTALIFCALYFVIFIAIMLMSHISLLQLLKSIKAMWFLALFLLIIYVFIPNQSYTIPAFKIGDYQIYWDGFFQCGYIILRLVLMISLTMILTVTTKPLDLTFALEWYMTPFAWLKFPTHIIAMMISIALRFIPTIIEETDRIMKAQSSRGVDFSHGGLIKRFRAIISLFIPLIVSAFERSEQLADAMEARGYDPKGERTRYKKLSFHLSDLISFILVGAFSGFMIYLSVAHNDLNLIKLIFNVEPLF